MNWKVILFVCAAALAAAPGCDDGNSKIVECDDIPANGCTLDQGDDACIDPTCAAAYACNSDGTWTLDYQCPNFHAPTPDASVSDGAAEAGDPGPAAGDAALASLPPGASGGPGCMDLENPDCPASDAILCDPASTDPCCGCESLFVCTSGNWVPWGECTQDGGVMQTN